MEKHRNYAYRITKSHPDGWEVTVFHRNEVVGPVTIYSDEALPEWIRKDISLLNLVDVNSHINGLGHRVGSVYWIFSNAIALPPIFKDSV